MHSRKSAFRNFSKIPPWPHYLGDNSNIDGDFYFSKIDRKNYSYFSLSNLKRNIFLLGVSIMNNYMLNYNYHNSLIVSPLITERVPNQFIQLIKYNILHVTIEYIYTIYIYFHGTSDKDCRQLYQHVSD